MTSDYKRGPKLARPRERECSTWAVATSRAALEAERRSPRLEQNADYPLSAPTAEHFIPVLYVAGLAGAANRSLEVLNDAYAYGSLSMPASCQRVVATPHPPRQFPATPWCRRRTRICRDGQRAALGVPRTRRLLRRFRQIVLDHLVPPLRHEVVPGLVRVHGVGEIGVVISGIEIGEDDMVSAR